MAQIEIMTDVEETSALQDLLVVTILPLDAMIAQRPLVVNHSTAMVCHLHHPNL